MSKPTAASTAKRGNIGTLEDVEEALQILEGKVASLSEGTQEVTQVEKYNDLSLQTRLRRLRRDFDNHSHRQRAAGDTYASYFKASYAGSGANIDIAVGYLEWQPAEIIASAVTINTALDGVHMIFLKTYYNGITGTWVNAYEELIDGGAIQPAAGVDRYDIAQVTVTDGAIDSSTLIQHQFGTIMDAPANKEVRYRGDFAVFSTSIPGTIYINAGRIKVDESYLEIGGSSQAITLTADTYYLYYEFDTDLTAVFGFGTGYPLDTSTLERILIAEVVTDGVDVTGIKQIQHGDYHSTRWPAASGGATSAYFAVAQSSDTQFTVGAGRVIHGTGSEAIPAEAATTITGDGNHYVFIEMSDSTGWTYSIDESTTHPTQSNTHERVVLGIVTMAGGVITAVAQVQFGEIHSERIWD